jgi:hypothetical protein
MPVTIPFLHKFTLFLSLKEIRIKLERIQSLLLRYAASTGYRYQSVEGLWCLIGHYIIYRTLYTITYQSTQRDVTENNLQLPL